MNPFAMATRCKETSAKRDSTVNLVDTALRDSAFAQSEATPQVLSKAKNNMVALPGQLFYSTRHSASTDHEIPENQS